MYWIRVGLLAMYGLAAIISMGYAIFAVIPKFGEGAPQCKIFFGHIVGCYGRKYEAYHVDVMKLSDTDWLSDISSLIVENCHIANAKHKRAGTAARWALGAIVAAVLGIGIFFADMGANPEKTTAASQPARTTQEIGR